ncbi:MAG: NADPH-dependent 7-cyano-7-deazaguanine reductase QueF [Myxococcales bacterium]|nr:NADPH-dependent 7-cyano-7-deazaguanine reductase QueF [Myxococcales bacterium]
MSSHSPAVPAPSRPTKTMERFHNPRPERDYEIRFDCPEFTCLCPLTGQPDFATIKISYTPDQFCVELKSLKMYLWSFRDTGAFHEAVTNEICDDLVKLLDPRHLKVEADFWVRGGITTIVTAEHRKGESPHLNLQEATERAATQGAPGKSL